MSLEKMQEKFTKYEIARILGARALQLAMDAPVLLKIAPEKLEEINYDVLKIAELEFESEVLPITVKRPFPKKVGEIIKKEKKEEVTEEKKKVEKTEDQEIEKKEELEEKEVKEEGEIMELATPDDEMEGGDASEEEGV